MAFFTCGSISPKVCVHAIGNEDRIIAETMLAARRKGEMAVHLAFESFASRHAASPATRRRRIWPKNRVAFFSSNSFSTPRHGDAEILGRTRPARRINAGRAVQRIHPKAGIIGQRRMMAGIGGGARFQFGIGGKSRAGLFRFGQAQLARR